MKTLKVFIGFSLIALFLSIFGHPAYAQAVPVGDNKSIDTTNPNQSIEEQLGNSLPFKVEGVNCGYAGTKQNKCCTTQEALASSISFYKDSIVSKFRNNNVRALTADESVALIEALGLEPFGGYIKEIGAGDLSNFIISKALDENPNPGDYNLNLSNDQINQGIPVLERKFVSYEAQLSEEIKNHPLKARARRTFSPDKCLINIAGGHGLCIRGIVEFFASIAERVPMVKRYLGGGESLGEVRKCVRGEAEGEGAACLCTERVSTAVLCEQFIDNKKMPREFKACQDCYVNKKGVWTGAGCLQTTAAGFIQETLLGWAIGVAGLFALLCIIYASFMLQTSGGNPERIKKAREYLTSCIVGLLLIIFSVFILQVIGVNILRIPGFGQ